MGCHLWGCTESDVIEATQQQQQQGTEHRTKIHTKYVQERENDVIKLKKKNLHHMSEVPKARLSYRRPFRM